MEARQITKPMYSTDMTNENLSMDNPKGTDWECGCSISAFGGGPKYCAAHKELPQDNRVVTVVLPDCVVQASEQQIIDAAYRYNVPQVRASIEGILRELLARGLVTLLSKE